MRLEIHSMEFNYGEVVEIAPGVRRIIAENPSPFTLYGTGTYILGTGNVAVIDPGPADPKHIQALVDGLPGETISHLLVTHTHMDHSPGCALLRNHTDAPTYAYGAHGAGKLEEGVPVEEGGDMEFQPDQQVRAGDVIEGGDWSVECVYTPGHTSNHVCFQLREQKALFTGDHVMGWSTTVISPPDGDMADYMASLRVLSVRDDEIYYPTHGAPIKRPQKYVRGILVHRKLREAQILDCLDQGLSKIPEMVTRMYKGLDPRLTGAAGRSIFSHIIDLTERGIVVSNGVLDMNSEYNRA